MTAMRGHPCLLAFIRMKWQIMSFSFVSVRTSLSMFSDTGQQRIIRNLNRLFILIGCHFMNEMN